PTYLPQPPTPPHKPTNQPPLLDTYPRHTHTHTHTNTHTHTDKHIHKDTQNHSYTIMLNTDASTEKTFISLPLNPSPPHILPLSSRPQCLLLRRSLHTDTYACAHARTLTRMSSQV